MKTDYFKAQAGDTGDISGDDVNRRLRESRLGHAAPSADWADCKKIVYCLWPGQEAWRYDWDGYYHNYPKFV
jgi:hypothetical protein